jgi:SWI/SNF-related matrix-associated actin-dependent regulator 1 of chromatin subfamily A
MSYTITAKPSVTKMNTAPASTAPSKLTPEQLKRMEENRQRALQLKQKSSDCLTTTAANQSSAPVAKSSTNNQPVVNKINSTVSNQQTSPPKSTPAATGPSAITSQSGKCVFMDEESEPRFEVHIGYNKSIIDLFKSITSKRYDPVTKRWNFSMKHYDELLLRIKHELKGTVKLEPLNRVAMSASRVARFVLLDRTSFEVHVDYMLELQELFKTLETKRYDPVSKRWAFSLKDYSKLVAKINAKFTRGEVTVVGLPRAVRETFKSQIVDGKNAPPRFDPNFFDFEAIKTRIDLGIVKSLLAFQIEGICFAIQLSGRILLADDMGLGKTIQGLAIASYYKAEWPVFIVGEL